VVEVVEDLMLVRGSSVAGAAGGSGVVVIKIPDTRTANISLVVLHQPLSTAVAGLQHLHSYGNFYNLRNSHILLKNATYILLLFY
jgi:hypothetical protein